MGWTIQIAAVAWWESGGCNVLFPRG